MLYLSTKNHCCNYIFSKLTTFRKIIQDNIFFIFPYATILILASVLLGALGNSGLFIIINNAHSSVPDHFFLFITYLGDGMIAFMLALLLIVVSLRHALAFLIITLLITVIVTILKRAVFPELVRPVEYFRAMETVRLVDGYDPPGLYTFPSGHSATAYSISLYLSFLISHRWVKLLLFVLAFQISFSRIYLSAHFPVDAVAGSLIAIVVTILGYWVSKKYYSPWIDKRLRVKPKIQFR